MTPYLLLFATLAPGQGSTGNQAHFDFRKGPFDETKLARIGPWKDTVKETPEGLHIVLPEGKKKENTVGVSTKLLIKGDFEITLAYKLVDTQPKGGYGAGVMMWFMLDNSPTSSYAAMARRTKPGMGEVFSTDFGHYEKQEDGKSKQVQSVKSFPAKAQEGQLRIKREGSKLTYLVADGGSNDFREIRAEESFAKDPIKHSKFAADTGLSENRLEVYIRSLTIRTPEPLVAKTPDGTPVADEPEGPTGSVAVVVGIVVVSLLVFGGVLFWLRRRPADDDDEEEETD